jgi:hypothetical protein
MHHPKRSESDIARQLVLEHGTKVAHQKAVGERTRARRARSRSEFQYWSVVISVIESVPWEGWSGCKGEIIPREARQRPLQTVG